MKRVVSGLQRVLVSSAFKKTLIALLIFCFGLGLGVAIGRSMQKPTNTTQSQSTNGRSLTPEQRTERSLQRLEESYDRAKERIARDVEAKRLTQEQADTITAKLNEVYDYRKANTDTTSSQNRDELQNKRKEWRDWLEQNDISSRYFIGVL